MADILIGVDAGTSVIKSIAFDLDGRQLAVAATPNRYQTRPDGAAFQSLDDTWEDCAHDAARARRARSQPGGAHGGDRRDRAGRRNLVGRRGKQAGHGSLALVGWARRPDSASIAWRRGGSGAFSRDRQRAQRMPAGLATRAHEGDHPGGGRAGRCGAALQGLALSQSDGRSRHRSLGGLFHLRRFSQARL